MGSGPERRAEALSRVGAIVDEPRFHGHLTGRENLAVIAAARGRDSFARIDPVLDRVGLTNRADDRVKAYSMGMRQRLGIARCLLADPELLILDEPMNGLDPAGILEFRHLIKALVEEGRTVMLSSTCSTRSRRPAISLRSSTKARSSRKGRSRRCAAMDGTE